MRSRLLIVFVLIVGLPVAMLAWVGWLFYEQDKIAANTRLQELNRTQLVSVEASLQDQFSDYGTELAAVSQLLELRTDSMRYLAWRHPLIRQVIHIDAQGKRLQPPLETALTNDERALLSRASSLFNGGLLASASVQVLAQRPSRVGNVVFADVLQAPTKRYEIAQESYQGNLVPGESANNAQNTSSIQSEGYAYLEKIANDVVGYSADTDEVSSIAASDDVTVMAEASVGGDEATEAAIDSRQALSGTGGSPSPASAANVSSTAAGLERASVEKPSPERASPEDTELSPPALQTLAVGSAGSAGLAGSASNGWYSWHHDRELRHAYWQRLPDNSILAFELEAARVKADLIGRLPNTVSHKIDNPALTNLGQNNAASRPMFRDGIRLVDAHGERVYQWGQQFMQNRVAAPHETHLLAAPLAAWRLEYFRAPNPESYSQRLLLASAVLGGLVLVLGLAAYFWREQTRTARTAQQRVSFVNQVSHELKTPLTNVRMYAEMAADQAEQVDDPVAMSYLDVIVSESQRLSRLISNVLSFAQIQRDSKLQLRARAAVPDETIEHVLATFAPAFSDQGIAIDSRLNAGREVPFDPDVLEQVLNNLLGNVEKYAGSRDCQGVAKVELTSEITANYVVVTVRDYGPGIHRKERKKVFDAFYRIHSQLSEGVSGTGIGLSIARELTQLHGGDLALQHANPGCHFTIKLQIQP